MSDFIAKMHRIRFRLGLRPRPRWGSLHRSPRPPIAGFKGPACLPTCLLLTPVGLCPRVRGAIARTRYINVLTDLLTYIGSTIGCANFGPDWPLLFKVHEI